MGVCMGEGKVLVCCTCILLSCSPVVFIVGRVRRASASVGLEFITDVGKIRRREVFRGSLHYLHTDQSTPGNQSCVIC